MFLLTFLFLLTNTLGKNMAEWTDDVIIFNTVWIQPVLMKLHR